MRAAMAYNSQAVEGPVVVEPASDLGVDGPAQTARLRDGDDKRDDRDIVRGALNSVGRTPSPACSSSERHNRQRLGLRHRGPAREQARTGLGHYQSVSLYEKSVRGGSQRSSNVNGQWDLPSGGQQNCP